MTVRVVIGASFLAIGVLECSLSHLRSIAVLCMFYKIMSNLIHPLCGARPVHFVLVRVTRGAPAAQRYSVVPQYRMTFTPLSVSL